MTVPVPGLVMSIPADLALVRIPAAALQGILRSFECTDDQAAMIELCVVEAINNAIEHAYAGIPQGNVELKLELDADTIAIAITDTGRAMPAGTLERARAGLTEAPGEPREGGYGLGIIAEVMADVRYRTVDSINTLTMTIKLDRRPA